GEHAPACRAMSNDVSFIGNVNEPTVATAAAGSAKRNHQVGLGERHRLLLGNLLVSRLYLGLERLQRKAAREHAAAFKDSLDRTLVLIDKDLDNLQKILGVTEFLLDRVLLVQKVIFFLFMTISEKLRENLVSFQQFIGDLYNKCSGIVAQFRGRFCGSREAAT